MGFASLLALLLLATPALAFAAAAANVDDKASPTVQASPPPSEHKLDALGLPLLSFNSDLGFGVGAVGGAYVYGDGYAPYRHAISAQVFFTQHGAQNHYLRYDGPKLIGPFRVDLRMEYRRELFSPYFGLGNQSAPDFTGNDIGRRYSYERLSPGGFLRLRAHPFGERHPLQTYFGYAYRWTRVTAFEGSALALAPTRGAEGGSVGMLLLGALWDTRDNESDSTSGGLEEIAVRAAARPTGSDFTFAGVTLSERRFFRLGKSLVFAQRATVDVLLGDVPFFELANFGGLSPVEGLGGMGSVRGLLRQRYVGNVKAFSNSELRFQAWSLPCFGQPLKLGAVAFVDVGRVWAAGVADGPWYRFHPGVGAGLRAARGAAVVRLDYGLATETLRSAFYVTFGQMF